VLEVDDKGRMKLSMKVLLPTPEAAQSHAHASE